MNKKIRDVIPITFSAVFVFSIFLYISCGDLTGPEEKETATITGYVIDNSGKSIGGASIVVTNEGYSASTTSNDTGYFELNVKVEPDTMITLEIDINKYGYEKGTIPVYVTGGGDYQLGEILLKIDYYAPIPEQERIEISGIIYDSNTNEPISKVVVLTDFSSRWTTSDSAGYFSLGLKIVEPVREINFTFNKDGYVSATKTKYWISPSDSEGINLGEIRLTPATGEVCKEDDTHKPSSIAFISATHQEINVKEVGGIEQSILTFEVRDSSGTPLDIDTTLIVSILHGPGGGETISNRFLRTNSQGQVEARLISGIKAGVVQILATIPTESGEIKSIPVIIVIHSGLPDESHFSLAAEYLNIPGLVKFGVTDNITAYVGDKYGNYVKDGTAVYFTTSGGMIYGAGFTQGGEATATLKSCEPLPEDGFVTVTAKTADRTNDTVNDSIVVRSTVLFSGAPMIRNIHPQDFYIIKSYDPNLHPSSAYDSSRATIYFEVEDENGNPLVQGTKLSVTPNPDAVSISTNFPTDGLPDTQDTTYTNFKMIIVGKKLEDILSEEEYTGSVTISISVSGPNGMVSANIVGFIQAE